MTKINQFTLMLIAFALIVGVVIGSSLSYGITAAFIAFILILRFAYKAALNKLLQFWLGLGVILGKIINPIILSVLYVFVVSPVGLLIRIFGKNNFKKNKHLESYFNVPDKSFETSYFDDQF